MAQIIRDDERIDVSGTFEEVLERACSEAQISPHHRVLIETKDHRFLVKSDSSSDDGNKIAYGWVRRHDVEAADRIEKLLKAAFPNVHAWVSRDKIRIAYVPNTKSDVLSMDEVQRYIELLKGGFVGRWMERPKK